MRNYYTNTNFCIITPYDAQRAAIQNQLKAENLPWDCVYNEDNFQGESLSTCICLVAEYWMRFPKPGNEADCILVSVVRTSAPGFLTVTNRMNVLLTRCRAGMVIVTNRDFILGCGQSTLLGKLCLHWTNISSRDPWVDWKLVAEHKADLPGAPGSYRPDQPTSTPATPATTPFSISYPLPNPLRTDRPVDLDLTSTQHFPPLPMVEGTSVPRPSPSRSAGPAALARGRDVSYNFQAHAVPDRAPLRFDNPDRNASVPPTSSQIPSRGRGRGRWASTSGPFPMRGSTHGRGHTNSGAGSATSRSTVRPNIDTSSAEPTSKSSPGSSQPFIRYFVVNNIIPDAPAVPLTRKSGPAEQRSYAASLGSRKK